MNNQKRENDLLTGAGASGCFPPDPPLQNSGDLAGREWKTTKELREKLWEQVETGTPLNKHASFALLDDLDTALAKIASLEAQLADEPVAVRTSIAFHEIEERAWSAEARATALEEALRLAKAKLSRGQPDRSPETREALQAICLALTAQPATGGGEGTIAAKQVTLGLGLVDITKIEHEGKCGVLFRPRTEHIPFGDPGELPEGKYWPTENDVVLWVDGEGPGVTIEHLTMCAPPTRPAEQGDA